METEINEDPIFPTPNHYNNTSLKFHNSEGISRPMEFDDFWAFLKIAYYFQDLSNSKQIVTLFEKCLKISGVAVNKLSQVLSLINPCCFITIDKKLYTLFAPKYKPDHLSKRLNDISQNGFTEYMNCIKELQNIFEGCELFELNYLAYLIAEKKLKLNYDGNSPKPYYWHHISSAQSSNGRSDKISAWIDKSIIAVDNRLEETTALKKLIPGDIIVVNSGTDIFHGIAIVYNKESTYEDETGFLNRNILWILKRDKKISGFPKKIFGLIEIDESKIIQEGSYDQGGVYDQIYKKFPEIWRFLANFSEYSDQRNPPINNLITEKELKNMQTLHPLNQILYGPPGTGKTYNTIRIAAEIIENRNADEPEMDYDKARNIFEEHLHNRIQFITFHQNYSYEDFVQGLRPETESESGSLQFKKRDGIFVRIVIEALFEYCKDSQNKSPDESYSEFVSQLKIEEIADEDQYSHKKRIVQDQFQENPSVFRNASGKSINNYVLIIDEINRANISRVFGELITLIEPDKRSDGANPLSCKLPSGDLFTIPSNLYIIGTMNTADKSIALVDVALRRRFEFVPMYPKYKEIAGLLRVEILKKINDQIMSDNHMGKQKGRDLQIGHSYFICENDQEWIKSMNNKVIPLLLEYFMNDSEAVINILTSALKDTDFQLKSDTWPLTIITSNQNLQ